MASSSIKSFSLLFFLSLLAYVFSFFTQIATSFYFGTSPELDAYYSIIAAAGFFIFYINPIRDTLIKVIFTEYKIGYNQASKVLSSALTLQFLLAGISSVLFIFEDIREFVGVNFTEKINEHTIFIFLPYLFLFGFAEIINGLLISFNKLYLQSIARLASSAFTLIIIFLLANKIGIYAMLISVQFNQIVIIVLSVFGLRREKINIKLTNPFYIFRINGFQKIFTSLLISYFFAQLYVVIERFSMLSFSSGLVSSFLYSTALVNIGISIIVQPMMNLAWPKFLEFEGKNDNDSIKSLTEDTILILLFVLLLGTNFVFFNAYELVDVIYGRGKFDAQSIMSTSKMLKATIFTCIPIAIYTLLTRLLITKGYSKSVAFAAISIAITGILVITLSMFFNSISLISSHWLIGNSTGALIAFILTKKKINLFILDKLILKKILKIIFITLLGLIILFWTKQVTQDLKSSIIKLLINAMALMLVIIPSYLLLKVKEDYNLNNENSS
ncbi:lipid II flippase MurJ [Pedobacter glucosidilyticus]|uniref:lipid II flippase MurJ n=1 Tax=Pedobacter glucosidilyticus TaxID=1122941 RepID=UPI0004204021|nr:lipid II flippase MurJ [Pedobacter glucosidilyticus]